jgi:hypothetical protein
LKGRNNLSRQSSGVPVVRSHIVTVAKQKGTPLRFVLRQCIAIYVRRMTTFVQGVLNSGLPS